MCCESSFAKQKFIMTFCSVQRTAKCSKVNHGCDKPCVLCTTRHLRGMNVLRWVILACGMSSQISWITRHNCTLVSAGGSRDLIIWQSLRSLADARRVTGRWVRWPGQCMDCIWSQKSCVSLVARRCLFRMGPRYAMLIAWDDYAWSVWIFGRYDVLAFCNSSCGWSPLIS